MAGSLGIRWIIDRLYTWLTVTQVDFLLLVLPSFSLLLSKRTRKRTGRVPFLTPLFSIHFEYQFLASCSARKDLDTRNIPHSARLDRDLNGINGPLPCPIKSTRTGSIHFRYNRNVCLILSIWFRRSIAMSTRISRIVKSFPFFFHPLEFKFPYNLLIQVDCRNYYRIFILLRILCNWKLKTSKFRRTICIIGRARLPNRRFTSRSRKIPINKRPRGSKAFSYAGLAKHPKDRESKCRKKLRGSTARRFIDR